MVKLNIAEECKYKNSCPLSSNTTCYIKKSQYGGIYPIIYKSEECLLYKLSKKVNMIHSTLTIIANEIDYISKKQIKDKFDRLSSNIGSFHFL